MVSEAIVTLMLQKYPKLEIFGEDKYTAAKIVFCESSGNEKAKNKNSSARGLLQILYRLHKLPEDKLLTADYNIEQGYKLYKQAKYTFKPWNSSRKCWSR